VSDLVMLGVLFSAFAALFGLAWLCQAVRG
jgi:hypothetical protein